MRRVLLLAVLFGCSDPADDGPANAPDPDMAVGFDLAPPLAIDDPDMRPIVVTPDAAIAVDLGPDAQLPDAAPDVLDPDVVLLPDVPTRCRGVDCSELDEPCATGTCDPNSGDCYAARLDDGAACDDGRGCTQGTICSTGICGGGQPVDCSDLDGPCSVGRCDADTGECATRSANEGGDCDPGDPCQTGGQCRVGECRGEPLDCSELDGVCVAGECDPELGCLAVPTEDGVVCDAADPCLAGGLCEGGACVGENVRDCSMFDGPCVVGSCDEEGACFADPVLDGTRCDAGDDPCSVQYCQTGVCLAPRTPDCSELDAPCMEGVCAPGEGCVVRPAALCAACDGGLCDGDGGCLALVANLQSGFEGGGLPNGFVGAGDAPWENVVGGRTGARALSNGDISHNQTSDLIYQFDLDADAQLRFWFRVSSEERYDFFEFIVNGNPAFESAGEVDWQEANWGLPAGQYELVWRYRKDGSLDRGEDRAWIDDVELVVGCAAEGECVEGRQVEGDQCLACPVAGCE